jgi:hypothetical protein
MVWPPAGTYHWAGRRVAASGRVGRPASGVSCALTQLAMTVQATVPGTASPIELPTCWPALSWLDASRFLVLDPVQASQVQRHEQ